MNHSFQFLTCPTLPRHGSLQGGDLLGPATGAGGDRKKASFVVFRRFQVKLPIFHCLPCFTVDVFSVGTGQTIHDTQQKLHTNSTNFSTTCHLNSPGKIHLGKCVAFDLSLSSWPNALQFWFETSRIPSTVPHRRCVASCPPNNRGH